MLEEVVPESVEELPEATRGNEVDSPADPRSEAIPPFLKRVPSFFDGGLHAVPDLRSIFLDPVNDWLDADSLLRV